MAKSQAYSPELSRTAQAVANAMGLPEEHARKAVGGLAVSTFKATVERGLDYESDFVTRRVGYKLQDSDISRKAAEADRAAQREHGQFMALADLEDNAAMSEEDRTLLGLQTKEEILDEAALTDRISKLQAQLADVQGKISEVVDTETGEVLPS